MAEYHVAYMCVYSDVVDADTPEEAAEIVACSETVFSGSGLFLESRRRRPNKRIRDHK